MIFRIKEVDENAPIPDDALCQEASMFSFQTYVPCGSPARTIVRHDKDRRSYYMCDMCADHNLRNRGGKLVKTTSVEIQARYG